MSDFWVYILRCADGRLYVGHTDDLERRLAQHATGELAGYTSLRRRLELVLSEPFPTRDEAVVPSCDSAWFVDVGDPE